MLVQKRGFISSPLKITRTMMWLFILGYGLLLVSQSTYQNYQMNQEISQNKQKIAELEQKKKGLELSLIYFKSSSYQEIEARRRLNLKGDGEHVVALPEATSEPQLSIAVGIVKSEVKPHTVPYIAWWQLFFSKEDSIDGQKTYLP